MENAIILKYLKDLVVSSVGNSWFLIESHGTKKHFLFNNESCELGKLPSLHRNNLNNIISKVVNEKKIISKPFFSPQNYLERKKTPRLMLFLTASCNLQCVYCHCNSETQKGDMDEAYAISVVKKYIKHVYDVAPSTDKIEITFMGGGEPFLRIKTIKKIVHYIDSIGINGEYTIVTNGTVGSTKEWEWLISREFRITISADGPPPIQNQQRKFVWENGKTSDVIEKRFGMLSQNGAKVNIRSTVMDVRRNGIKSICDYFEQIPCVKTHHLEPVSFAGRASSIKLNEMEFYSYFFRNYAPYLYKNPARYKSAWFKPFKKSDGFCGAVYSNAIVTHDGYISLCSEVDSSMRNTNYGKKYISSHVNHDNPFLSLNALEFAEKNSIENIDICKNCIIRYKCGGGCYIKRDRDFKGADSFYNAYCKNAIILNMSYLIDTYEYENVQRQGSPA